MATESEIRGLMRDYTPLAVKIANGFKRSLPAHIQMDDLRAAAMGGLWDAIRLRPDSDYFEQYARIRISGSIKDDLRRKDWFPRSYRDGSHDGARPMPMVYLNEVLEGSLSVEDDVESRVDAHRALDRFVAAAESLPSRHRMVLMDRVMAGREMKSMALELGLTQARVSQIYGEALAIVKKKLLEPQLPSTSNEARAR